jgi:hypothetical protein
MMDVMKDQNELVTKKMFFDGMSQLEARMEAKFDAKIDALALSTQQEFVAVREEIKDIDIRLTRVEENMATKQDLYRVEARILSAIGDIAIEIKNHDRRILALEKIVKL